MSDETAWPETRGAGFVRVAALTPAVVHGICLLAGSLGFAAFRVDLEGCTDKDDFLERTARALAFPDWFGRNWDALLDCLADLGWQPAPGYVLVYEHTRAFRSATPDEFATAIAVLADAAESWQSRGVAFRVFMDAA